MFKSLGNPQGGVVSMEHAREAILIEGDDLPEVALPNGSTLQVLQVDLNNNPWIVRDRFKRAMTDMRPLDVYHWELLESA